MTALLSLLLIFNLVATLAIVAALRQLRTDTMAAFDDLKATVAAYSAKVDAYVAAQVAHQQTVDEAVAAAVAADDAGEDIDIKALDDQIKASAATVPEAPVAPTP